LPPSAKLAVYVQGFPDLDWGPAMRAIEMIRGLRGEVFLLKPAEE